MKHRRDVFAPARQSVIHLIAASVCRDLEAELLEHGGEEDHAYLRVTYPPQAAVVRLVNSLAGVNGRRAQRDPHLEEGVCAPHLISSP